MHTAYQTFLITKKIAVLSLASVILSACSGSADTKQQTTFNAEGNIRDVIDAATGPLEDLNLKKKDIPPVLKTLLTDPYAPPKKIQCASIKGELTDLDNLLGPDMDANKAKMTLAVAHEENGAFTMPEIPEMPTTDKIIDTGGDMAHDRLMGFIRSQTDILPFRSVIRFVSGADRHEKLVKQAYQAGALRRAYLKGLAEAKFGKRCLAPPVVLEARVGSPG